MDIRSRVVSCAALAVAGAWLASSASAQCVSGGAGGNIPDLGDGTWDTVLPSEIFTTLALTVPAGATVLSAVKINGLSHTWGGDMQFVLEAPGGARYNLVCGFPGDANLDFNAINIEIVDPLRLNSCTPVAPYPTSVQVVNPGTYAQGFGGWVSGNLGITNTPLESIPIANGTWTLHAYDWFGFDAGSFTDWELCFGLPTPPAPSPFACVGSGPAGSFPIAGTDGTWSTVMPTGELTSPLAVTVPAGSTKIKSVKVRGFTHTWSGDCQLVLQAPNGTKYNLFQQLDGVYGGGCSADFAGDYDFVDVNVGQSPCGGPAQVFTCAGGMVSAGALAQYFGLWPDGDSGIFNTPLESIPVASGTWNLICYDWYVLADDGAITGWDLCFDVPTGPTTYCTPNAPGTSHACVPTIAGTANPNVAHSNACLVTVSNVEGQQSGIIYYGLSTHSVPWCNSGSNSFLCVKAPLERTGVQNSGGALATCNGTMTLDWNAYQLATPNATGQPWTAGESAYVQGWFRDPPSCKTTFLSQALTLTYVP